MHQPQLIVSIQHQAAAAQYCVKASRGVWLPVPTSEAADRWCSQPGTEGFLWEGVGNPWEDPWWYQSSWLPAASSKYHEDPKILGTLKIAVIMLKSWRMCCFCWAVGPKAIDGIVNSVDSDQTAPWGAWFLVLTSEATYGFLWESVGNPWKDPWWYRGSWLPAASNKYRENPNNWNTRKIAVIILKVERCGVNSGQIAPSGAVWCGSTLFAQLQYISMKMELLLSIFTKHPVEHDFSHHY